MFTLLSRVLNIACSQNPTSEMSAPARKTLLDENRRPYVVRLWWYVLKRDNTSAEFDRPFCMQELWSSSRLLFDCKRFIHYHCKLWSWNEWDDWVRVSIYSYLRFVSLIGLNRRASLFLEGSTCSERLAKSLTWGGMVVLAASVVTKTGKRELSNVKFLSSCKMQMATIPPPLYRPLHLPMAFF